jgi:hypothetical protein
VGVEPPGDRLAQRRIGEHERRSPLAITHQASPSPERRALPRGPLADGT